MEMKAKDQLFDIGESKSHWISFMSCTIITTPAAPAAPASYSQAVKAAGLVFVSGTVVHEVEARIAYVAGHHQSSLA